MIIGNQYGLVVQQQQVKTYEFTSVIAKTDLQERYPATFGDAEIELIRTSDTTLSFIVPDVTSGPQSLTFDLGRLEFSVTRTEVPEPDQLVGNVFSQFDKEISQLETDTVAMPDQQELEEAAAYKKEVMDFYNSLSVEEQRGAALFYEANKDMFAPFRSNVISTYDAPTVLIRSQSDCPTSDFKAFYSCTAGNLGQSIVEIRQGLRKLSQWVAYLAVLSEVAVFTGPVGIGLTAVGTTLSMTAALYILATEVKPAFTRFRSNLIPFLRANWILGEATFLVVVEAFSNGIRTNLNLDAKFQSVSTGDAAVSSEVGFFIRTYNRINSLWDEFSQVFGSLPGFSQSEMPFEFEGDEVMISGISNDKVKLVSQNGEQVAFESSSEEEESFTFTITVKKEGFEQSETVNATIAPGEVEDFPTIEVNGLTWMAKNLWIEVENSWCYDNDPANCEQYGRLYTWEAAKQACAELGNGWRLPTEQEWQDLLKRFSGDDHVNTYKAAYQPLIEGGNSGFNARLGGARFLDGSFLFLGDEGYYWSATGDGSEIGAYGWIFRRLSGRLIRPGFNKSAAFSCRCVRE